MFSKTISILKYIGIGVVGLFIFLLAVSIEIVPEETNESVAVDKQPVTEIVSPEENQEIFEEIFNNKDLEEKIIKIVEPVDKIIKSEIIITPVVHDVKTEEIEEYIESEVIIPIVIPEVEPIPIENTGSKYYTSSYHSAKYYYPEDCSEWEDLSLNYLQSYNSLEALLLNYSRILSPEC